ncbi:MAG: cupin domain-containing protein [Anaerolineae bacterium]|nr:cupin domain-containing protein [Anaerolineae bacterium]
MIDVVRASDVEPVEMVPGVWRRMLTYGEQVMIVQVTLEEGAVVPAHRHPHEQITYVIEGELSMDVEGQTHVLGARDSLLFPAGVEHGATALKRTLVIDTFSPPREEYKY